MARKPWEIPIQYNDSRFDEPESAPAGEWSPTKRSRRDEEFGVDEGDMPARKGINRSTDATPLDYSRGPHDREFGVDDNDEPAPSGPSTPADDDEEDHSGQVDEDGAEIAD